MPEPTEKLPTHDAIPANGTFSPDRTGVSSYHFLDNDWLAGTARVTAIHSGSIDLDKEWFAGTALVIAFHSGSTGPTADIPHLAPIRREDTQKNAFERRLFQIFALEPVDYGYAHPAEGLLEEALVTAPNSARNWIRSIVANEEKPASVVAGIVHCLSRLERNVLDLWALDIGEIALAHSEVEVREAGVRVMETVGGPRAIEILRTHQEQVSWMRRYIAQVIANLSA